MLSAPRLRGLRGLEVGEEAVDDCRRLGVVLERFADHTGREVEGKGAHLGPEGLDGALTLGFDLRLGVGRDACCIGRCLLADLVADRRCVGAGLLTDAGRLGAGVGELLVVLVERSSGLLLSSLCLLDATLDGLECAHRASS
ncbi:hypothetical protein QP157_12930 [Sphingomonas sp. LR61]